MEEISRHKKLFLITLAGLALLCIWHLFYVAEAAQAAGHMFLVRNYCMLALGGLALCALTGILLLCTGYPFEKIWLIVMMLMGVIAMRVLPGLSAPDEPVHYVTAYRISDMLMFTQPEDEEGHVMIRARDFAVEDLDQEIEDFKAGKVDGTLIFGQEMTERMYYEAENWPTLHPDVPGMTVSYQPRLETTPLVYIPQALGITMARLLHLPSSLLITFGRVFNLLAFAIIIYAALKLMPFGKELMAASTLLPMTVTLAASMSYDALLIAGTYYFIAVILDAAYRAETVSLSHILRLTAVLAVIGPCKMVYGVILLLVFLIPKEKFKNKKQRALAFLLPAAALIISMLAVNLTVISRYVAPEAAAADVVWQEGETGWSIAYAIRHPLQTVRIVYDTVMYQSGYYHQTLVGAYLGNADENLDVPYLVVMAFSAILLLLGLKKPEEGSCLKKRDRLISAGVIALLILMLMGCMLIGWTPLSSIVILGVQGRYLLPVLPLLLLLISNNTVFMKKDISKQLIYLTVCLDVFAFVRLFSTVSLHL